ncbi:MAG: hypothetical protein KY455_01420 [Euryarchaeota archaeon]|nr:hypothetical protein [Euryarchaeota archaeon]
MARPSAVALALTLLVGLFVVPTIHADLGVDRQTFQLGKVDPGLETVRFVNVTNKGTSETSVVAQVECACDRWVTVEPGSFTLAAGATQQVRLEVAVGLEPDPGIHDYDVRFTEVTDAASGGTAKGAIGVKLNFFVRTAGLFLTHTGAQGETLYDLADDGTFGFNLVNGFEEGLDVTVSGAVSRDGDSYEVGPVRFDAEPGGDAASSNRHRVQTGITPDSEPGIYELRLMAEWSNKETGETGSVGPRTVHINIGTSAELRDFTATVEGDAVRFTGTIVNTGGTTIEARMVVEVREGGNPDLSRLESDLVTIAPDGENTRDLLWENARESTYSATAYAVFKTAGEGSAFFAEGPRSGETGFVVGDPEADGSPEGTEGPADDGRDLTTTILVAAGVGLLVGAAVAFVALRKRG